MGYLSKAVFGVGWIGMFRLVTRSIAFLRTIVLARILSPSQFGIFGIASLIITLLEILFETGVNVVLIQKKEKIDSYLDTAWAVSIARGAIISFILILIAPFVANFFGVYESQRLIYLVSIVSLIRGFINPSIVRFQKELRFQMEFWFKFFVFAFDSLVAITVSFVLLSSEGIVWGLIAGALLEVIISFLFVKPRPRLNLEITKLKEIISKGKWVNLSGIFQFLFRQGDDIVVGRILGESNLGIYQVAYKISSMPISEVTDVVNKVVFPVYVKIAGDRIRLKKAFLKTTLFVVFGAFVIGVLLFIFGEPIVRFLLGEPWLEAVPLIKILIIYGIVQALINSVNSLFLAFGKQIYITLITFISFVGLAISIFPLVFFYGLRGAAAAPLIGSFLGLPFMIYFLNKVFVKK